MPTKAGKTKGRKTGKRRDREALLLAVARLRSYPVDETCEGLGISRPTYYRLTCELDRLKAEHEKRGADAS